MLGLLHGFLWLNIVKFSHIKYHTSDIKFLSFVCVSGEKKKKNSLLYVELLESNYWLRKSTRPFKTRPRDPKYSQRPYRFTIWFYKDVFHRLILWLFNKTHHTHVWPDQHFFRSLYPESIPRYSPVNKNDDEFLDFIKRELVVNTYKNESSN